MIQVTPQMRILLAVNPVDFRKGIDGLAGVCRQALLSDPFSGHVFIFRNKKASAIKVLMYDGQGFWLCQKRLSKGRFSRGTAQIYHFFSAKTHCLSCLVFSATPYRMQGQIYRLDGKQPQKAHSSYGLQYPVPRASLGSCIVSGVSYPGPDGQTAFP